MLWQRRYLAVAVLLTFLDGVVALKYGKAVWTAWSGDMWARGLLVLFAALGATSLAGVWAQAGPSFRLELRRAVLRRNSRAISPETRESDV
ncbi:MAG TPA: hypothetical protein VFW30_08630 [Bryocella sp.]|nr:hypothetical protein [Bryocella sp.]